MRNHVFPDSPAFPETHIYHWQAEDKEVGRTDNVLPRWHGGLTKREYFAGQAMTLLARSSVHGDQFFADRAIACVAMADALIEALNNTSEPVLPDHAA